MVQLFELHHYAFLFGSRLDFSALRHCGDPFTIERVSTT